MIMNELPPPLPPAKWSDGWTKLTANQKIGLCVIVGVAVLFMCAVAVIVGGLGESEIAFFERSVKVTIEDNDPKVTITKVTLIKESKNYYSGLAECKDGRRFAVEAKGTREKSLIYWKETRRK
jgi:hypothetical protein